ncbi:XRE family transcriptional regulator [Paenibacillus sp. 481]|uniref:XRE family transcriptional regulator n=1 Tax=Paenibacillus sp. 481 TaxID=2835869 RepID=UPI001E37B0A2|nr:XRE family transcriptional regulator [Paenibacillus sp. 481]UHA74898.1 XRE family transcriptional regulator [Paenibacillus sp. 481]
MSKILNNKQSLMLHQLHAINEAFEFKKYTLYDCFIGECYNEAGRLKQRKTSDFILHCIQAEQYEAVKRIVYLLHEDNNRNKMLDTTFTIAEHLFESDKRNFSLPFYDIIVSNGISRNETLAIAYYKRFMILRDLDTAGAGQEALHQLVEYLPLLPDGLRFDAYYRILTFYNVLENWPKLLHYAEQLKVMALAVGQEKYVAEGWLYESFAHKGMGNFKDALHATMQYASYGKHYAWVAKCNEFYISIEMGQTEHIDELMSILKEDENQTLLVIPMAIKSFVVNHLLLEAQQYLTKYHSHVNILLAKNEPFYLKHKLRLYQALSDYYFATNQLDRAFGYNAMFLKLALKLAHTRKVEAAVNTFHQYEEYATTEQKNSFKQLFSKEVEVHEKSIYYDHDDSFLVRFYRSIFY